MAEMFKSIDYPNLVDTKEKQSQRDVTRQAVDARAFSCMSDGVSGSLGLYYRQMQEKGVIDKKYGKLSNTWEKNDINIVLDTVKKELYSLLGIQENTEMNSLMGKFQKWIVDGLIIDNIDFVKQIIELGIETVVKELMAVLGSVEKLMEIAKGMYHELKDQIQNMANLEPYDSGKLLGGMGFGVIGSIGKGFGKHAMKSALKEDAKKDNHVTKGINKLAEEKNATPPKIWELEKSFTKLNPQEALNSIKSLNTHINVTELINTPWGIRNFAKTVENISIYVEKNHDKIGTLKWELTDSLLELRRNMKSISKRPEVPPKTKEVLVDLTSNMKETITKLTPKFWPSNN